MRFVYIIEDEAKFQQEICEAIAMIDPKIQIRIFPKLEAFVPWLKHMMKTGPAAIAQGGEIPTYVQQDPVDENEAHQLVMVMSKIEFLGVEQLELLKKTRKLFIERHICTAEDPTSFVLSAFDKPNFKIRDLENRILSNVIFKPFDRLILTQHLTFAIDGRHPPSKYTVANQKTSALVEMLKEIQMESISDIGMVTKSDREIPVGAVAKYYGTSFLSDRHRSLFAICRDCRIHPQDPQSFQGTFTFFAADQTQITNMRKKTRAKEATPKQEEWISKSARSAPVHILFLDEEEESPSGLLGQIQKTFTDIKISAYQSFGSFLSDLDPGQAMQDRDASLKALGGAETVTLHFDISGVTYLDFDSDKKDLSLLFGVPASDWKTKANWLAHAILPEHRERYRKYIQTGQLQDENIFPLAVNDVSFLIKVIQVSKNDGKFHVTITEPGKEEQVAWLQKNTRLQDPIHLIVAHHQYFGEGAKERWTFVHESIKRRFGVNAKIVMTSKKDFTDAQERMLGSVIDDIFFKPVDRVYFAQKIKYFLPQLKEKSAGIEVKTVVAEEIIKAVNPVKVSEISEAGVVMQYYRPISLGSFREIVLWQPYEVGAPELLATCNFVEESPSEKGVHNCHLVFFGVSDHFLKHIRIWIRDNYVLSKEGSGNS